MLRRLKPSPKSPRVLPLRLKMKRSVAVLKEVMSLVERMRERF